MGAIRREPDAATLRCAVCGDVIGVYEPLVHIVSGIAHRTSRAANPSLAYAEPGSCYHLACSDLDGTGLVTVE